MSYSDPGLWFSTAGRVNRQPYFFASFAAGGLAKAIDLVPGDYKIAYLPILLFAAYAAIALSIKRCHDRGRSGFFILLNLIPIVNLWPLIELTFLKGETGPNRYGPDPLEAPALL